MKQLEKYSIGVGDRFAHQAMAQLAACQKALDAGVEVVPVWNKSNREHTIIGSEPNQTRYAADQAVAARHWMRSFYCDADHINLTTVDRFLHSCDFFTIDVADCIGKPAAAEDIDLFVQRHPELTHDVSMAGIDGSLELDETKLRTIAEKFSGRSAGCFRNLQKDCREQGRRKTSSPRSRWTRLTRRRPRSNCW